MRQNPIAPNNQKKKTEHKLTQRATRELNTNVHEYSTVLNCVWNKGDNELFLLFFIKYSQNFVRTCCYGIVYFVFWLVFLYSHPNIVKFWDKYFCRCVMDRSEYEADPFRFGYVLLNVFVDFCSFLLVFHYIKV